MSAARTRRRRELELLALAEPPGPSTAATLERRRAELAHRFGRRRSTGRVRTWTSLADVAELHRRRMLRGVGAAMMLTK